MTQTIIGALLEKHDIAEGIPALNEEIEALSEEIALIDEKLEAAESDEERQELEEARATADEKRQRRLARKLMKKDPSYKKAVKLLAKKREAGEGEKWTIQKDPDTGNYHVAKKDLKKAKQARIAAKGRTKS